MEGSRSTAVTQKSGVNIESLPQELVDVVFDQVQLDRIADDLPQLKEPICPAFLNSIRRNLYRDIVLKSHASFMLLVESVVNGPEILAQCIEGVQILTKEDRMWARIRTDFDISTFFIRANRIERIYFNDFPLLTRFLLSPFAVARCMSSVAALDLGNLRLATGSTDSLVSHFGSLRQLASLDYLQLEYVPEEGSDEGDESEEENEESEGSEEGDTDRGDSDWEDESESDGSGASDGSDGEESGGEDPESSNGSTRDWPSLTMVSINGPMSRPDTMQLVCALEVCHRLALGDTSSTYCNFLPVLDAIDPWCIAELCLRDFTPMAEAPNWIDSVLDKYVHLEVLEIAGDFFDYSTFAASLSSFTSLETLHFEPGSSPPASTIRSLISGPTKLKSLKNLQLDHINAHRGGRHDCEWDGRKYVVGKD